MAEATDVESRHNEGMSVFYKHFSSIRGSVPPVIEEDEDMEDIHVVLLGDSTLDNGRYLNFALGELSVERQFTKRCLEEGWHMTILAQDGSVLEDVLARQLPLIPDCATHIVISISGNDLLGLLNEMVVANFSPASVYRAIINGLAEVSERYRHLVMALKRFGCHLACCTVYQPAFNHMFFKSLASVSLGLHNSRIKQMTEDLDASVIDLANLCETKEDFANALELSTRGGAKLVENVSRFVNDHPPLTMARYRNRRRHLTQQDDEAYELSNSLGLPLRCCAAKSSHRRVYCEKEVSKLQQLDRSFAAAPTSRPLKFSEEQQRWREA